MIEKAQKSDKKAVMRFYKQQRYSARLMGFDHTYIIRDGDYIIAAAIASYLTAENNTGFLHGLVVDKNRQKAGLGKKLLEHCSFLHQPLICFADQSLSAFYLSASFKPIVSSQLNDLLQQRYHVYKKHHTNLIIFSNH